MANLTSQLLVKLVDGVSGPARKAAASLAGIGAAAQRIGSVQGRLQAAIEKNNAAIDKARGRMVDAVAVGYALQRALTAPVRAAMDFESAMADVRKVVDFATRDDFLKFQQSVIEMTKRLPLAANELSQIVAAAGQAGIAREDLLKFTEMAAKVGVAFDISARQTGDALAKMMTGLGLSVDQVGLLADAMNHLSNAQASSAADILDVVRRVGAQSKQFGFNAVQVSAFASAMLSAGAESEVAATSFRNMGLALTKGASATKGQREAYKALGLDARKVSKAMQKDAVGTTVNVLERIAKLPKDLQASLSSELFGNEARALGPLLTNLDLLKKSLGLVAKETDYAGSATKEYDERAKTFANNLKLFQNRINAIKIAIGNALIPALTMLLDRLSPLAEVVERFAKAHPALTRNLIAATAALLGFRVGLAGLSFLALHVRGAILQLASAALVAARGMWTLVASMAGFVVAPIIAGLRGLRAAMAGLLVLNAVGGMGAVFAALGRGLGALALSPFKAIGAGLRLIAAGMWALVANPVGLVIAAVVAALTALGVWIYNNWDGIKSFFAGFGDGFAKGLGPAAGAVKTLADGLGSVVKWLGDLLGPLDQTSEGWKSWGQTIGEVAGGGVKRIIDAIGWLVDKLGQAWDAAKRLAGALGFGGAVAAPAGGAAPAAPAPAVAGKRAAGGPIYGGRSYLVGEQGAEIITPTRSGYVHPSGSGGGVTINQTISPVFSGITDVGEIMRRMERSLSDATSEALRGLQSDYGFART